MINEQLRQLFIYEEFAAKYDEVKRGLAEVSSCVPTWMTFEKGIEKLSNSVIPMINRETGGKKGLRIEDLVIKVGGMNKNQQRRALIRRSAYPTRMQIPVDLRKPVQRNPCVG